MSFALILRRKVGRWVVGIVQLIEGDKFEAMLFLIRISGFLGLLIPL